MAVTPLSIVATDAWEQALFDSESRYFAAAADNMPLLGGTLSLMPDLASLPAGCVLYDLDTDRIECASSGWLRRLEETFRDSGSRLCRLYLPADASHLNETLLAEGYRPVRELGMVGDLCGPAGAAADTAGLVAIDDERGWRDKTRMYCAGGAGPDGHDMAEGRFAELERSKCRAGYMRSYLYHRNGRPVATVSLALNDGFARLKNAFVHPAFRDRGVGQDMVRALMLEARRLGARRMGCFASSKTALRIYRECGLWDMCFQTEWSRPL